MPDVSLHNAAMGGGKIGYYFPQFDWLGVETEGYLTEPKLDGPGAFEGPDWRIRVATWAFNAMVRYPGTRFQPYGGVGLGVFFFRETPRNFLSDDNWAPGLNALAGMRTFLTEDQNVALFAEYKYNSVRLTTYQSVNPNFNNDAATIKQTYSANIVAGGISFHFDIAPWKND